MTLNNFLRGIVICIVFAVLVIPFIVADSLFFPFITGKGFFFRTIVEVGFAAWLLLTFRDASARPRKSVLMWAFLAFMVVIGLADIFGENPWKSFWSNFERMEGYVTLIHLFFYFIVATSVLTTEKLWRRWLEGSLVAAFIVTVYSFLQLAGELTINQGGVRVDAKFGNATYLAVFLIFNIFFALILAMKHKGEVIEDWLAYALYFILPVTAIGLLAKFGSSAYLYQISIVVLFGALFAWLAKRYSVAYLYAYLVPLMLFVLLNTGTRGAVLGLLGGLLLSALLAAIFEKKDRVVRIAGASIVGFVVVVVVGFIAVRDTDFVAKSPILSRFASISLTETKTQARAYIWPMAIEGWKERPILGWGQENFNYIFNKNYNPKMYAQEQWFDHTHNIVLDWLVAGGILGLLSYLSLLGAALYLLWKKANDLEFTEKALLTGLGAAYLFHNLFVFDNIVSYVLFVSVLAYIHFKSTRLEVPVASDSEEMESSDMWVAGPVVLVALCIAIYFFVWRGYATGKNLIVALQAAASGPARSQVVLESFEKALSYDSLGRPEVVERLVEASRQMNVPEVPIETRQKFFKLGEDAVKLQLERYEGDARYEVFAGNFYNVYGNTALATEHFENAVKLSPNKQTAIFQLGASYITAKQYDKAAEVMKKAYELEPSYAEALKYYATSLMYAGREAEARALFPAGTSAQTIEQAFLAVYADLGNWNKVASILKILIAADPNNMELRMNLVAAYFQGGNKAAAISALREMIALSSAFKEQGERYIKEIQAAP